MFIKLLLCKGIVLYTEYTAVKMSCLYWVYGLVHTAARGEALEVGNLNEITEMNLTYKSYIVKKGSEEEQMSMVWSSGSTSAENGRPERMDRSTGTTA